MIINHFFKNKGPFKIEKLLKLSGIDNNENFCMYPPAIASLKKRPENCPVGNLYPNKL